MWSSIQKSHVSFANNAAPIARQPSAAPPALSFLHDIVGKDGVLMIALESQSFRSNYAVQELHKVGIFPTLFPATDGNNASQASLEAACYFSRPGVCAQIGAAGTGLQSPKMGVGCLSKIEQGIADSHKRALEAALHRAEDWTAIFEDDAAPVTPRPGIWNDEFRRAWSQRPPEARVVRLSWCYSGGDYAVHGNPEARGTFIWVKTPRSGGCTSAYMVHKSVIPELLKTFPCCMGVDGCWEKDFFTQCDPTKPGTLRSMILLYNLDVVGGAEYIGNLYAGEYKGIIMQARNKLATTRDVGLP